MLQNRQEMRAQKQPVPVRMSVEEEAQMYLKQMKRDTCSDQFGVQVERNTAGIRNGGNLVEDRNGGDWLYF